MTDKWNKNPHNIYILDETLNWWDDYCELVLHFLQVSAVDLIFPIVGELCGGSLREDNYSTLESNLTKHDLLSKLDWYLELRKYGNVPTGGFGLGFERFLQVLTGNGNIKDVIPYPRHPHNCKM